MKQCTRIITCASLLLVGWISGVIFERYHGVDAAIEWAQIEDALIRYRVRREIDRTPVEWLPARSRRVMVALVFGQSNAGNSGETTSEGHSGVYEYYRGKIYEARDPLLNSEGNGGTIWVRLGASLIKSGDYDAVVLVPVAIGSSPLRRWAPGGNLHGWLTSVIAEAHLASLEFTHLLWQHGEADAMMGTTTQAYTEQFNAMLDAIRSLNVKAPVFVAQSTQCGRFLPNDSIREAQAQLANSRDGIHLGPDTDKIGREFRYDGCHFSTDGLDRAAALWREAIAKADSKTTGLQ